MAGAGEEGRGPPLADARARELSPGSGSPPAGGFAAMVPEFGVADLAASLAFWCGPLGFAVAYDRPAARFAYIERGGAQAMLCELNGRWSTGALAPPLGRGLNMQITVDRLGPILDALAAAGWPLFEGPNEAWYRTGPEERGQREALVQDPDGYLLRLVEHTGTRTAG